MTQGILKEYIVKNTLNTTGSFPNTLSVKRQNLKLNFNQIYEIRDIKVNLFPKVNY
jgi:hypothetical protein